MLCIQKCIIYVIVNSFFKISTVWKWNRILSMKSIFLMHQEKRIFLSKLLTKFWRIQVSILLGAYPIILWFSVEYWNDCNCHLNFLHDSYQFEYFSCNIPIILTWFESTCTTRFSTVKHHHFWRCGAMTFSCPFGTCFKCIHTALKICL